MKITRIFSDEKGESHFEDLEIPLIDQGEIGYLSENFEVKNYSSEKFPQITITISIMPRRSNSLCF